MSVKTQIKKLLSRQQDSSLLSAYLALSDDEGAAFDTTRPIPTKELIDIYRVRASLNQRRGSPIAGFDELLEGLEAFGNEQVRIHGLSKPDQMFVIFTDASVEELIGVLTKPAIKTRPELEALAAAVA